MAAGARLLSRRGSVPSHGARAHLFRVDGALYALADDELHLRRAGGPSRQSVRARVEHSWKQDWLAFGVPARLLGADLRADDRLVSTPARHSLARVVESGHARAERVSPRLRERALARSERGSCRAAR